MSIEIFLYLNVFLLYVIQDSMPNKRHLLRAKCLSLKSTFFLRRNEFGISLGILSKIFGKLDRC